MNATKMIGMIFEYVRKNGMLTNKAQSDWGQDRWDYNGIVVGLGDAGYTKMIQWGDRLYVWDTYGRDIKYENGDENELRILFKGMIKDSPRII